MPSATRRQFLAVAGSATLGLAGCLSTDRPSGAFDQIDGAWPMVGRNSGHTRQVDDGPTDPEPVWTTGLAEARAVSSPSLADERLYVPVDAVSETARHRYRVHALSATTGEERWQVPIRAEPNGPPAVAGERIVVTARPSRERGRVVCFQNRYGDEEWLVDVDARLTAPPTVSGGAVYVADWRGRVQALSVTDGSELWSRTLSVDGTGRTVTEAVAVEDGTLYLGSQSGSTGVVALDAETGEERWRVSTGAVTGGPIVSGDLVVVRSHHRVLAFDTEGSDRWSANVLEADARPMAADDQYVYVPAHDRLQAIRRNGEAAWRYESPGGRVGTPTATGETVLVRGEDRLTALARATGEPQWTATPQGVGSAVVTPEAVFLPGRDGQLLALGDG